MAGIVTIREEYLTDIADAIREKTDSDMPLTTDAMAPAIRSIEGGGGNIDLSDYATIEYVDSSLEGYATEDFVTQKITEAELGGGEGVDLSDYATKEYVMVMNDALQTNMREYHDEDRLAADGFSIINEDGVLRTAIGGGIRTSSGGNIVYEFDKRDDPAGAMYPIWNDEGLYVFQGIRFPESEYEDNTIFEMTVTEYGNGEIKTWTTVAELAVGNLYFSDNQSNVIRSPLYINDDVAYFEAKAQEDEQINLQYLCIKEAGESETTYEPIDPQFIPVDGFTTTIEDGKLTAHTHVNIDEKTIISNADGYFQTAIGGYKYETEGETIYEPIDANFIPVDGETVYVEDGVLKAVGGGGGSAEVTIDNSSIIKNDDGELAVSYGGAKIITEAAIYQPEEGQLPTSNPMWNITLRMPGVPVGICDVMGMIGGEFRIYYDVWVYDYGESGDGDEVSEYISWIATDGENVTISPGSAFEYNTTQIETFQIATREGASYVPIDAGVIPVDDATISIVDGVLSAVSLSERIDNIEANMGEGGSGVSEDRVYEIVNEALGVIENGTY